MNASRLQTKIIVVDDEPEVRCVLRAGLEAEGWDVVEAADRESLMEAAARQTPDLVTLDLRLGAEDGFDIARELRSRRNIPVVMITGKGEPFDRVNGLENGADDYIVKPFHIREVVLRLRHVLARYTMRHAAGDELAFGDILYNQQSRTARHIDGGPIALTGFEAQLLGLFLSNPGRILSRDDISRALHGRDWSPLDRTIDGHVARLRRKIEPLDALSGESPRLIRSVRGVGYILTGRVQQRAAG